jgi:cob(I)alamin adenosyltransferase
VPKDDPRVEAYGTVDELNAQLGLAHALLTDADLRLLLEGVQRHLFDLGADLAALPGEPSNAPPAAPRTSNRHVAEVEAAIDRLQAELPPLKHFILPGGSVPAALLHLARTLCRRAERRVVTLHRNFPVDPEVLRYLNRLSDLLFVMARVVNTRAGIAENRWES